MSDRAEDRTERLRRFLADLYGLRIVDVESDDIHQFRSYLDKHGWVLVDQKALNEAVLT